MSVWNADAPHFRHISLAWTLLIVCLVMAGWPLLQVESASITAKQKSGGGLMTAKPALLSMDCTKLLADSPTWDRTLLICTICLRSLLSTAS